MRAFSQGRAGPGIMYMQSHERRIGEIVVASHAAYIMYTGHLGTLLGGKKDSCSTMNECERSLFG
jgi:hypothetical protein